MKIKSLILLAVCLLTGCVNVPKTTINGSLGGKPFALSAPKDADLSGLHISANTNGAVEISVEKLITRMNPDVIAATAAGQAQIVKESMSGAGDIAGKAIAATIAAMGVPKLPPATSPAVNTIPVSTP